VAVTVRAVTRISAYPGPASVSVAANAGDLLVLVAGYDYTGQVASMATPTSASGTLTRQTGGQFPLATANGQIAVYTVPITATGTHTVTLGNNGNDSGVHLHLYAITGHDTANPVVAVNSTRVTTAGVNQDSPSITAEAGSLLIAGFQDGYQSATAGTKTGPASMTYGNSPAADNSVLGSGSETITAAGATGTRRAVSTASRQYLSAAITIRAAAGGAPTPVTGTGALTTSAPTLTGAGTLRITGTGTPTAPARTLAGTAAVTVAGTGTLTAAAPTLAGTGEVLPPVTGTGTLTAPAPDLIGTGALTVTGTGTLTATPPVLAGTGTATAPITGTGALTPTPLTLTGTGVLTVAAAGQLTARAATVAAAVLIRAAGAGALGAAPAALAGDSRVTIPGSGILDAPPPELDAPGEVTIAGTGPLDAPPATLTGRGGGERRDVTVTVGPLRARSLTADPAWRTLTSKTRTRTLTVDLREEP
jgi:hypothetical protein